MYPFTRAGYDTCGIGDGELTVDCVVVPRSTAWCVRAQHQPRVNDRSAKAVSSMWIGRALQVLTDALIDNRIVDVGLSLQ